MTSGRVHILHFTRCILTSPYPVIDIIKFGYFFSASLRPSLFYQTNGKRKDKNEYSLSNYEWGRNSLAKHNVC